MGPLGVEEGFSFILFKRSEAKQFLKMSLLSQCELFLISLRIPFESNSLNVFCLINHSKG